MATIDQLRQLFKTDSDEEAILAASKRYGIAPQDIAGEVGFQTGGKWGNRASAAVDSYQANLYGVAEAAGAGEWARRGRERNEAAAGLSSQFARDQGAIDSYKDVRGFGDAADYVGGLAVQSLPYMGEALAGGIAGGVAARGLQLGGKALAAARMGGAAAAGYPSAVGDILANQREQSGRTDLGSAAALALPYAALNAGLGLEGALARGGLTRNAVRALDEAAGFRGGLARGAAAAGRSALEEGASETGQEMLNQLGRMQVDPGETFLNERSQDRFAESFVGGAALGGVFGGAGGWRRSRPLNPVDQPGGADLLNPPAPQLGYDPTAGQQPMFAFPDGSVATTPEDRMRWEQQQARERNAPQDVRPDFELTGDAPPANLPPPPGFTPVQAADPNQASLFNPDGSPTYGADPTFSPTTVPGEVEFEAQDTTPQFGFTEYAPRQGGVEFQRDVGTGGLSLAPLDRPEQFDLLTGQYAPASPAPQEDTRPPFQLEMQDGRQGTLDFGGQAEEAAPQPGMPTSGPRSNQRGFVGELPFAPPEAKITTPVGQKLFGLAESLASEGYLDDASMTQVATMLAQNKHAAASKLIEGALSERTASQKVLGAVEREQAKAQLTAQQEAARERAAAEQALIDEGRRALTEPTTDEGRSADDLLKRAGELSRERQALVRKDGRRPLAGTAKGKQWDALTAQLTAVQGQIAKLEATNPKPEAKPSDSEARAAKIDKYERLLECLRS